jgi:hypothetical protein
LTISDVRAPAITVDDLEVAQFIYLLIYNQNIRRAIDTITSKVVLILGRFTDERKSMLDAIREKLRSHDYIPVMFDFAGPLSRDLEETVSTLAHLARFIVADLTEARSIAQELSAIVPRLKVPVQPVILTSETEYGLFESFRLYPWVLQTFQYVNRDDLLANLEERVIFPAERKVREIREEG